MYDFINVALARVRCFLTPGIVVVEVVGGRRVIWIQDVVNMSLPRVVVLFDLYHVVVRIDGHSRTDASYYFGKVGLTGRTNQPMLRSAPLILAFVTED